jgi:hypothetical protein
MPNIKRPLIAIAVPLGVILAGCGGSSSVSIPSSGRHVALAGSATGQIVLSALGAQRIGLQTQAARAVPAPKPGPPIVKTTIVGGVKHTTTTPAPIPTIPAGSPTVIVPYSAIVYDPSGLSYAFTSTGSLTYVEVPVVIDHVSGNSAYLVKGPKPGAKVVSVGAEELYGVQTGVLAQT